MKAYIVDQYKKKAALRFGEMPEPTVGDSDVLVEIHAAGLNLLDSKIRDGEFKPILPYRPPFILGHDLAGQWFRSDPRSTSSNRGTRSIPGLTTAGSEPSPNASR
jgi:NADPH:quinone reductase-like Zn-dependent oxidoreductase